MSNDFVITSRAGKYLKGIRGGMPIFVHSLRRAMRLSEYEANMLVLAFDSDLGIEARVMEIKSNGKAD